MLLQMPKAADNFASFLEISKVGLYTHDSRVSGTVTGAENQSATKYAKEHQQRSIDAAASKSSKAYLDIGGFRQQREQVLSHVLVHMQPAAVGGARDEAFH